MFATSVEVVMVAGMKMGDAAGLRRTSDGRQKAGGGGQGSLAGRNDQ